MFLIIGLGNPGKKYQNNRHNAGFMFINYLAQYINYQFQSTIKSQPPSSQKNIWDYDKKTNSEIFITDKIIIAKPQTFMNNCGQAVQKLIKNLKLKIKNLVIVHDDLDIPLDKFKIQKGIGPKLHNGIESIENILQTKDFWRVRIGVDNRQKTGWVEGERYVLTDFLFQEKEILEKVFPVIIRWLMKNFFNISATSSKP